VQGKVSFQCRSQTKFLKLRAVQRRRIDALLLRANVQDSGEARVSATFLLTIAEQFAAMAYLVEGKFSTHAPILVRSMLDELADLRNLPIILAISINLNSRTREATSSWLTTLQQTLT
jgi:hypothetical protein